MQIVVFSQICAFSICVTVESLYTNILGSIGIRLIGTFVQYRFYAMSPQISPVIAQLIANKLTTGMVLQQVILCYPIVAPATIYRHAAYIRCLGTLYTPSPDVSPCRPCLITPPIEADLVDLLAQTPTLYLDEIAFHLLLHWDLRVSELTVCQALRWQNITHKVI